MISDLQNGATQSRLTERAFSGFTVALDGGRGCFCEANSCFKLPFPHHRYVPERLVSGVRRTQPILPIRVFKGPDYAVVVATLKTEAAKARH
jgi:hypothetical protein